MTTAPGGSPRSQSSSLLAPCAPAGRRPSPSTGPGASWRRAAGAQARGSPKGVTRSEASRCVCACERVCGGGGRGSNSRCQFCALKGPKMPQSTAQLEYVTACTARHSARAVTNPPQRSTTAAIAAPLPRAGVFTSRCHSLSALPCPLCRLSSRRQPIIQILILLPSSLACRRRPCNPHIRRSSLATGCVQAWPSCVHAVSAASSAARQQQGTARSVGWGCLVCRHWPSSGGRCCSGVPTCKGWCGPRASSPPRLISTAAPRR